MQSIAGKKLWQKKKGKKETRLTSYPLFNCKTFNNCCNSSRNDGHRGQPPVYDCRDGSQLRLGHGDGASRHAAAAG